jgi:predicted enzyme related to lactoylglutathione lyase
LIILKKHRAMTKIDSRDKLRHEQVQYIEFLSREMLKAKAYYQTRFDWKSTDYEPAYPAIEGDYVDGGITTGEPIRGSILDVLYSRNIEATRDKVLKAGGTIEKEIFTFPGGKRFHFLDTDGYELAVWSE